MYRKICQVIILDFSNIFQIFLTATRHPLRRFPRRPDEVDFLFWLRQSLRFTAKTKGAGGPLEEQERRGLERRTSTAAVPAAVHASGDTYPGVSCIDRWNPRLHGRERADRNAGVTAGKTVENFFYSVARNSVSGLRRQL